MDGKKETTTKQKNTPQIMVSKSTNSTAIDLSAFVRAQSLDTHTANPLNALLIVQSMLFISKGVA